MNESAHITILATPVIAGRFAALLLLSCLWACLSWARPLRGDENRAWM